MNEDLWRQWQTLASQFAPLQAMSGAARSAGGAAGFAPFVEAGERFKSAAQTFLDSVGTAGPNPASLEAAQRFGDLMREQFADLKFPWSVVPNPGVDSAVGPFEAPALGATREHQQRWQRMAEAWRRIDDAQRRLQRLWSDALRTAATAFAHKLQQLNMQSTGSGALPALYDAWIDCAEDAYGRMAHGEAFTAAQAEFVNASSQLRAQLQAGVEHWAKLLDLPTRSEINSLTRRVKALEQQLRIQENEDADAPDSDAPSERTRRRKNKS